MKLAVGFGCLVTVAVLIGPAESDECHCDYVPANRGCKLRDNQKYRPGQICRCGVLLLQNPRTCSGVVVSCYLPGSTACISQSNTYSHCMQGVYEGQGDCCGYNCVNRYQCKDWARPHGSEAPAHQADVDSCEPPSTARSIVVPPPILFNQYGALSQDGAFNQYGDFPQYGAVPQYGA